MSKICAVITADIVNSRTSRPKTLGERLKTIMLAGQPEARVFFYRGDSFQAYLPDPYQAYRLALKLRTEAILFEKDSPNAATDVRMSIGIGQVDFPVDDLATAQGEAFILSGNGFDLLETSGRRLTMHVVSSAARISLEAISLFTDHLFSSLTIKQAEVLQYILDDRTQMEIATMLDKSQSTVNAHIRSLGWKQLEALEELYKESIQLIDQHG